MATFRVGQRVRIVGAEKYPRYIGMTATVTRHGYAYSALRPDGGPEPSVFVCIDGVGERRLEDGAWHNYGPDHLAPATDCYDKAEWRECAWQPPHMRETA